MRAGHTTGSEAATRLSATRRHGATDLLPALPPRPGRSRSLAMRAAHGAEPASFALFSVGPSDRLLPDDRRGRVATLPLERAPTADLSLSASRQTGRHLPARESRLSPGHRPPIRHDR